MVIERYPDHPTAQSARDELVDMAHEYFAKESEKTEQSFELSVHNYPNPFNPSTRIQFSLPESGRVVLKIYDILGRVVNTLVDADRLSGKYSVNWGGKNTMGADVASGMYFYQIRFRDQTLTNKMLLLR